MFSNSFRVIQISIAGISALLFFLVFYIKIFPKKKINLFALLLLVSLLPLLSILRPGTYESGDLSLQTCASLSFYHSLLDGQIIPRWGGGLINGFGSPYHMVMYILPYYIISLIHLIGLNTLNSIKLFLMLSFISSGMAMYLLMKKDFGKRAAFTSSVFYLFAPYHLIDMHFRVDIGEMAAFVFLPLTFFFINKIIKKFNFSYFALEGLSVAFLVLSHQAISLFFVPFIFAYAVMKLYKSKTLLTKKAIFCIGAILSGISFSSFYYFPILFEATKYTHYGKTASSTAIYLSSISDYLISPWRWGFLFQGPSGHLSFIIGYTQLTIVFFAIVLLIRKKIAKSDKLALIFLLLAFSITLFIMLPESNFLWNIIPLAKYTLSTYRYLLPLSFFIAIISGIVIKNFPNRLFFITVCFITIFYTILNWGNRGTIPTIANDSYFENIIPTYILGENGNGTDFATPIWLDMKISPFRKKAFSHLELISGNAKFKEIYRNSTKHEYVVDATTDTMLLENTSYYPGWKLKVDNKVAEINYKYPKSPGIITFYLREGLHKVELTFQNTLVRTIGDTITLITLILFIFMFLLQLRKINKRTSLRRFLFPQR